MSEKEQQTNLTINERIKSVQFADSDRIFGQPKNFTIPPRLFDVDVQKPNDVINFIYHTQLQTGGWIFL